MRYADKDTAQDAQTKETMMTRFGSAITTLVQQCALLVLSCIPSRREYALMHTSMPAWCFSFHLARWLDTERPNPSFQPYFLYRMLTLKGEQLRAKDRMRVMRSSRATIETLLVMAKLAKSTDELSVIWQTINSNASSRVDSEGVGVDPRLRDWAAWETALVSAVIDSPLAAPEWSESALRRWDDPIVVRSVMRGTNTPDHIAVEAALMLEPEERVVGKSTRKSNNTGTDGFALEAMASYPMSWGF